MTEPIKPDASLTKSDALPIIDATIVSSSTDEDYIHPTYAGTTSIAEPDYTADGVPTFDSVREKIENRISTAEGMAELQSDRAEEQSFQKKWEDQQKAGVDRLEEIRRSLRGE